MLDAGARMSDVAEIYGLPFVDYRDGVTLGEYLMSIAQKQPATDEGVRVGKVEFVIRELEAGRIKRVDLRLSRADVVTKYECRDAVRRNLVASKGECHAR